MRSKNGGCSNFVTRPMVALCKRDFGELSLSLFLVLKDMNAKACLLDRIGGNTNEQSNYYFLVILCPSVLNKKDQLR